MFSAAFSVPNVLLIIYLCLGHWSIIEYTDHKFNGLANICLTFIVWVFYAVILVSASALFSHYVAQQAIGSGIPEMKTYAFPCFA